QVKIIAVSEAFATAILIGGMNALLDFVTTELQFERRPLYLVGRILLVCFTTGIIVGARARQVLIGVMAGLAIGLALAGTYHYLTPSLAWNAVPATWLLFWMLFAILEGLLEGRGPFTTI